MSTIDIIKRHISIFVGVIIILFAAIIFILLKGMKSTPMEKHGNKANAVVLASVVQRSSIPISIEAYGRVRSIAPITITSEVTGTVLAGNISFLPGQKFSKGDVLLRIDSRQAKLNLMIAKSQLLNAMATLLPEVKIEFPDVYPLWQKYFNDFDFEKNLKAIPVAEDAKIKLFLARFNVYQLYFSAKNLEILYYKHQIRAPFSGIIVSADLRPGASARQGTVIGQIIDTSSLEVEVQLPVTDLQWVTANSIVKIFTDGRAKPVSGKLLRIGRRLDALTETIPVYVKIQEHRERFADGQFVRVNFPPQDVENAFEIPEKALYDNSYIYIIKNGQLKKINTQILHFQQESVVLGNGPAFGDTVVIQAVQGAIEGMGVTARFEETGQ